VSQQLFPFGLSDKTELKDSGERSIFHKDGTPHLVDFSPRAVPSPPVQPTQPVVAQDPKDEPAQEPASSTEAPTPTDPSTQTTSAAAKQPAQPGATGGTTKAKATETSKPAS
jgi:hypothetical protein